MLTPRSLSQPSVCLQESSDQKNVFALKSWLALRWVAHNVANAPSDWSFGRLPHGWCHDALSSGAAAAAASAAAAAATFRASPSTDGVAEFKCCGHPAERSACSPRLQCCSCHQRYCSVPLLWGLDGSPYWRASCNRWRPWNGELPLDGLLVRLGEQYERRQPTFQVRLIQHLSPPEYGSETKKAASMPASKTSLNSVARSGCRQGSYWHHQCE